MKNTEKLALRFPPGLTRRPITCELIRNHDLVVNILRASINENKDGFLVVELEGEETALARGLGFLRSTGVTVEPLSRDIRWDQTRCIHCGLCRLVCPADAFEFLRPSMQVSFIRENCVACEACLRFCPTRAISFTFRHEPEDPGEASHACVPKPM